MNKISLIWHYLNITTFYLKYPMRYRNSMTDMLWLRSDRQNLKQARSGYSIVGGLIVIPAIDQGDAKCQGTKKNGDICKPKKVNL